MECGNLQLDFIIYNDDCFVAFSERNIIIKEALCLKTYKVLPKEVKKVTKVHIVQFKSKYGGNTLIVEAEHKDGSLVKHVLTKARDSSYEYN